MKKLKKPTLVVLFLAGLFVFLYPTVGTWVNAQKTANQVLAYEETVGNMPKEMQQAEWQKAEAYNNSLMGDPVRDPFIPGSGRALPQNYLGVLNVNGVIGRVEIPKIGVDLPIYHGTANTVLQKGVGHIEGTALPIGGKGTHSLLTSHTGLPSAELFTRLNEMQAGDTFSLHVLDRVLTYKVYDIQIILPDDISALVAYQDKDYATLITCTPYGVNSHRLLVRGERTTGAALAPAAPAPGDAPRWPMALAAAVALGALLVLALLLWRQKRRKHTVVPAGQKAPARVVRTIYTRGKAPRRDAKGGPG